MPPEIIDLDAQATSPLAPAALAAMLPFLVGRHWNPHSAHRGGRTAKAAVEAARAEIAETLGETADGLIFTSGATEANNLALKGVMEGAGRARLISFATEHSCVLETARHLEREGRDVTILPVLADGMPDRAAYRAALGPDVALVSAMTVNNEVGSIWPIAEMAAEAHAAGALFHTDAAQAFGKISLAGTGADLISLSAHKMKGPKGIGALWVRPGTPVSPLLDGGGQEAGIRSGTLAPALCAGFGAAARLARSQPVMEDARARMAIALHALSAVRHRINGPDPSGPHRWPGNLSVTFPGVDAGRLISKLPDIALSSGAACSSGANRPSHVLSALGLEPALVKQTLRIGWQADIDLQQFEAAITRLVDAVRALSPNQVAA